MYFATLYMSEGVQVQVEGEEGGEEGGGTRPQVFKTEVIFVWIKAVVAGLILSLP
jgi:hypothetical protein